MSRSIVLVLITLAIVWQSGGTARSVVAEDRKEADIQSLLAEKKKLQKRMDEIDIKLAMLQGKLRLPMPLEMVEYDLRLLEQEGQFELLEIRSNTIRSAYINVGDETRLIIVMKVKEAISQKEAEKIVAPLQMKFYKTLKGTDVEIHSEKLSLLNKSDDDGKLISAGKAIQFDFDISEYKFLIVQHVVKAVLEADSTTSTAAIPVTNPTVDAAPSNWPKYSGELAGRMEVRVKNPNNFKVRVGLRSEGKGKDFIVAANYTYSVRVPNGRYDIYFHYSTDPDGLYQGDGFTLNDSGVEIQIVKVVNGNYGIRKVK